MKNICLIIDTLEGGGAERVVLNLADILSTMGHRVDLILLGNNIAFDISKASFNLHVLDILNPKGFCLTSNRKHKKIAKILKSKINQMGVKFDLIMSNKTLADKICVHLRLKNLYSCVHGDVFANCRRKKIKISKFLCTVKYKSLLNRLYNNKQLITVSKGVLDSFLLNGVKLKNSKYIYNPANFTDIRRQAESHLPVEDNYIIHVGRFSIEKRHDCLLHAYKLSKITKKLLLVGDHNNAIGEKIKQLAKDLNLTDKIIFKGFKSNPYPYIKKADVLIISSDTEGLCTTLIEALILGTQVVSTNCTGSDEILTDELSQFLSPINNAKALSENIKKALINPVVISNKFIDKFSAETVANQYLNLCNTNPDD